MLSSATKVKTTYTTPLPQGGSRNARVQCATTNHIEWSPERANRGAMVRTVATETSMFGHVRVSKHSRRSITPNAVSPSTIIDTKKSYEGGKVVKVRCCVWVSCEVLLSLTLVCRRSPPRILGISQSLPILIMERVRWRISC